MDKQNENFVERNLRPSMFILWILMVTVHKDPLCLLGRNGKLIDYNVFESVYTSITFYHRIVTAPKLSSSKNEMKV